MKTKIKIMRDDTVDDIVDRTLRVKRSVELDGKTETRISVGYPESFDKNRGTPAWWTFSDPERFKRYVAYLNRCLELYEEWDNNLQF